MRKPFDNTYMFSPKIKILFIESKSWTVRWLAKQNRETMYFKGILSILIMTTLALAVSKVKTSTFREK